MKRLVQLITQVREVHHPVYSYGYVIWFIPLFGWFHNYGFKRLRRTSYGRFHDCTWAGIY